MPKKSFYWEIKNEHYDILPDKKYLIYYRGMFSPPTAGHFSMIEKFIDYPNVQFLIHQIGSSSRHGIPYWLNKKIWQIYIKELLPRDKIHLVKCNSRLEIMDYVDGIDVVLVIRGNEHHSQNMKRTEKNFKKKYKDVYDILKKRHIRLHYYFTERHLLKTLSATKFCESLLKIGEYDKYDNYRKLRFFLPNGLSDKAISYIINRLLKQKIY